MAKIRIELEVGADGAVKGISATSGALKGLTTTSSQAGTSFAKLTGSFISAQAIIGGVKAGFRLLKDTISDTIGTSASFQTAFTGVEKTLNTTGLNAKEVEVLFRELDSQFKDLNATIPVTFEELSGIGEVAGQLGVGASQIVDFTDTIAKLGVTTTLTSEQAATQLARLANVTGGIESTNFERLGSALVALGNNFQTTESEILGFAQRIAATGDIVGLAQTDILALGAAFTSAGVPIEAGGTAVQKTLIEISDAVAQGGADLQAFAAVAGQSASEFAAAFREDAGGALVDFLGGLSQQGEAAFGTLERLGLGSERTKTALLSAAQSSEQLAAALELSSTAFEENTALAREAELRFGTFDSQLALTEQRFDNLQDTIGDFITENQALGAVLAHIGDIFSGLDGSVEGNREAIIRFVSKGILIAIEAVDLLADAFQFLSGVLQTAVFIVGITLTAFGALAEGILQVLNAVGLVEDSTVAFAAGLKQGFADTTTTIIDSLREVDTGVQGFEDGLDDLRASVIEATDKQIDYEQELGNTALRYPDVVAGTEDAADATEGLGDAAGETSEEVKKLAESLGKLSSAQIAQDASNLVSVIEELGGVANLSTSQVEAAGQQLALFEKNGVQLTGTLAELKARLEELKTTEAISKLVTDVEALGSAAQKNQTDILVEAVKQLGDTSKLSDAQIEALAKEIDGLGLEAKAVPPELEKIQAALKKLEREAGIKELTADFKRLSGEISMEGRAALEDIEAALEQTTDAGFELSREAMDEILSQLDELAASDPGLKEEIEAVKDEFDITTVAAIDFGQVMQDITNIMSVFGIEGGSALGQILGGFGQLSAAIPQLQEDLRQGNLVGGAIGQGDVQGAVSGIAGGIAGVAQATSRGGAGASAGRGAIAGATAGAQVAGPIGAAIGGIAGAITGFFRGRGRDKLRRDIDDAIGSSISEELALAIKDSAKEAGRSIEDEALLNLGDINGESGIAGFDRGITGVQDAAVSLLQGITDGSLPAKEAIGELGQVFSLMADEVFVAGQVADAELINIVTSARAAGQEIPEIAAFVAQQLDQAAGGVSKLIGTAFEDEEGVQRGGGIQVFNAEDAQSQATIFASTFFATVEEIGLLEAVDAFEPAFRELQDKLSEFGGEVNFGGVGRLFEIAGDESFRPLLEGVQGLDEALSGLANSGFLTTESFSAFQQQAGSAFEQLTASGLTSTEALQQMGPLLNNLVQASNEFGIPLDANTQALIEQAEAAGVAFRVEPMQQVAATLVVIAGLLGATDEQLAALGPTATETGEQINTAFGEESAIGSGADEIDRMREGLQGVGSDISELPDVAQEAVGGIAGAFEEGSAAISEGLDPIADKMASEILEAGETTSSAIDESFANTNAAIEAGLGEVAGTFTGQVVPAALQAASATESIAAAAREAARAASEIDFPGGPDGLPDRSSAAGFRGLLGRDMTFQAHQGELVNVISADNVRRMRSNGVDVSAQNGAGGMMIDIGGVNIPITVQGGDGENGGGQFSPEFEERVLAIVDRAIREDVGGIVEDAMRPALQEQT